MIKTLGVWEWAVTERVDVRGLGTFPRLKVTVGALFYTLNTVTF